MPHDGYRGSDRRGRGGTGRSGSQSNGRNSYRAPRGRDMRSGASSYGSRGSSRYGGYRSDAPQNDLFHSDMEHEGISRRTFALGVLGVAGAMGVARLADYQIINAGEYRRRADQRRLTSQTLYAKRGTIYDRNGNVLASSVECQNVYVNPQLVTEKDDAVEALVRLLGVDGRSAAKRLSATPPSPISNARLTKRLPPSCRSLKSRASALSRPSSACTRMATWLLRCLVW